MAGSKKKNMGKVKHYRRSFYTGPQRVRRAVAMLLAVVVLFALGWFIGPHVIDLGTHTWYSIKRGSKKQEQTQSMSQSQMEQPTSQPQSQSQPQPQPEPTPAVQAVTSGKWAFVSLSDIDTAEKAAATAQQLAQNGVTYVVIPLKDEQGYIYYASTLPAAVGSVTATTVDAAAAARVFRDAGLVPVAQLCAFQDPKSPYTDRTMGIHYQNSEYFWLDAASDAGGKPWLDPYAPSAQSFMEGLMDEVRAQGFEHILLTGVQYPPTANDNAGFQNTAGVAKTQQLASLIDAWQTKAEQEGGVLWIEYTLAQASGKQPTALGGGTLQELGVRHLVIELPQTNDADEQQAQLEQARAAAQQGNAEHVVLRQGAQAQFKE